MAITLSSPYMDCAAAEADPAIGLQEADGTAGSQDGASLGRQEQGDMSETPSSDHTDGGQETSDLETEEPSEVTEETASEANLTNTDAASYETKLTEVETALQDSGITFMVDKGTFLSNFKKFCEEHAADHTTLSSFLDEYVKRIEKTTDKVTLFKCFGSVYGHEMDGYVKTYIQNVIETSEADQNLKDVSLGLLDLADSQDALWEVYDDWAAVSPEAEENSSYDTSLGSTASNQEENGEANGETTDSPEAGEGEDPAPAPPSNINAAVKELEALDYSTLSDDMKPVAQQMIQDAITKIGTATTEQEVSSIVEETKQQLKKLEEDDIQNIRIEVAINELTQALNQMAFSNERDFQKAKEALKNYTEMLKKTSTETEIAEIVGLAKKDLNEIAQGTGDVLTEARDAALAELTALKETISDKEMALRVYDLWAQKIRDSLNKEEVDKYFSGGKNSFVALKDAENTSTPSSYTAFLESLKLICVSEDDITLMEQIKANLNADEQIIMTSDFLMALENPDTSSFKKALLEKIDSLAADVPNDFAEKVSELKKKTEDAMAKVNDKKDAYSIYREAFLELKELNASSAELQKKIEENIAILEKSTTLDTEEAKAIIQIYKDKISKAASLDEADSLLKEAVEKLQKLEEANEETKKLTAAKEDAYKQLERLLTGITDQNLKNEIEKVISNVRSDIAIADSVDTVKSLVEKAKQDISELKKKYEQEKSVKAAREKAAKQIDTFLNGVKDADLKEQLSKIGDSAKRDLEDADDIQSINSILQNFKQDAEKLTKEYAADKALTAKKTSTVKKMTDYTNGKEMTNEMYNLYQKAKEDIMNAESSSEIDSIYTTFIKEFNNLSLASVKDKYSQKLDDLLNSVNSASPKYNDIASVISKAKDNISKATSQTLMDNIFAQAKSKVETLIQQSDTENDLDTIKEKAINELRNATTLSTSTAQKVISVYTNKIQNATSESEVEQALGEGKALLQKLNEAAGIDPDDQDTGTGALTNGSTMNKADGDANSNTTYSSTKKEDLTSGLKGDVKTGDENGFQIILSFVTILAGLGAIGFLLWKKLKK